MNFTKMRPEEIAIQIGYSVDKNGNVFLNNQRIQSRLFKGYYEIIIHRGSFVHCQIHRLQAFQKFGKVLYESGMVVRHLNGVSTDNSWENIALGTASDNMMDIPQSIRQQTSRNASLQNGKRYSREMIDAIKADRAEGFSYSRLMKKYNISSKGTVAYICNHDYLF